MSEIHICIIFICILLLIIISLLCDTNTITKIKNTLLGGSTENEVGNIRNEIKKEQDKIDTIKSELQSMERNKPSNTEEPGNTFGQQRKLPDKDDVDVSQLENNSFVLRQIKEEREKGNTNPIPLGNEIKSDLLGNTGDLNKVNYEDESSETSENSESSENITSNNIKLTNEEKKDIENKAKVTAKAWESMCEKDYKNKKKQPMYEDLKLNLDSNKNKEDTLFEPFNSDDFGEFGQFNC